MYNVSFLRMLLRVIFLLLENDLTGYLRISVNNYHVASSLRSVYAVCPMILFTNVTSAPTGEVAERVVLLTFGGYHCVRLIEVILRRGPITRRYLAWLPENKE